MHHAKKLAIYQACIIQPQLKTSIGRGGEWARLKKKKKKKEKKAIVNINNQRPTWNNLNPKSKHKENPISNLPLEQKMLERAINISFHTIRGPQPISKLGLVVRLIASFLLS